MTSTIEQINSSPMEDLRFKDFLFLKVGGRNNFSENFCPKLVEKPNLLMRACQIGRSIDYVLELCWVLLACTIRKKSD